MTDANIKNALSKVFSVLTLISCICATSLAQIAPPSPASEMLMNGSFAKGMPESSDPWGWIVNSHPNVTIAIENGVLKMSRIKKDGFSNVRQDALRELESKYRLSFKAKVEGKGSLVYGGHGLFEKDGSFASASDQCLSACNWTPITMDFEIPASQNGYAIGRIGAYFKVKDKDTTVYISSVSLTPIPDPNQQSKPLFLTDGDQKVVCDGILLLPDASYYEIKAAKILRKHLHKMYGVILPVVSAPRASWLHRNFGAVLPFATAPRISDSGKGRILIGQVALNTGIIKRSDIDALSEGGYVVQSNGGHLGIVGKDGTGIISGVYAILKKLGMSFPAVDAEEWETSAVAVIEEMQLSQSPAFKFRWGGDCAMGYTDKHCVGAPRDVGIRFCYWAHTADLMVNYNSYHKDHPEYFALTKKGARQKYPEGNTDFTCLHLCMSNPEVQRIALQSMLRWIELQPDRKYFMVSQGDYEPWCECKKCRALDPDPNSRTDRLLTFVNGIAKGVAEKYPDKKILTLAYTKSIRAPQRVKPESNVIVMFCPCADEGTGCQSHAFCEYNKHYWEYLDDWLKCCPGQMYVYDYPAGAKSPMDVFGSFYAMADKIRFYAKNGIKGVSLSGSPVNFTDLFYNVMSRLLWSPGIDIEKAIDEFMVSYYGKAAPMMREWFNLIHREVKERPVHHINATATGLVTAEMATKGYVLFDEAIKAAGDNQKIIRRINDEKILLLFSDLNERNTMNGLAKTDDAFFAKLTELIRLSAERRITVFDRKDWKSRSPVEWLREVAGLRLDGDTGSWWNSKTVEAFLKNPMATLSRHPQQEMSDNGWRINLHAVKGGNGPTIYSYKCVAKLAVWAQRASSPLSHMTTSLFLDKEPATGMELVVEGQDDDKGVHADIDILINGQSVFKGKSSFVTFGWSSRSFSIPKGLLRKGENKIEFVNTTGDVPPLDKDRKPFALEAKDYSWGWFMLSEIIVRP